MLFHLKQGSFFMPNKPSVFTFKHLSIIVLIAGLVFTTLYLLQPSSHNQNTSNGAVEGVAGMKIGGPFTLTHHDGTTVTDQTYKGKARVMFFGFTFCPDICPTELATMATILNNLSSEQRDRLNVLFISVDPERDTPEQLASYVSQFHENIHGLTGTKEQIEAIKKSYRVYSAKVEDEEFSDYTIDHSAFLYLFDTQDNLIAMFRAGSSAEEIQQKIEMIL